MIKDITSIKIGQLWNQGRGASFKDEIDAEPDLGQDARLTKSLQGDLLLIRMKEGLTAILENVHTETELQCSRCLCKFPFSIEVNSSERQFYQEIPSRDYDPFEVFLINKQEMSIDLTEMLRQEIILHFPMIPVCSERCKGLCPGCHVNLNPRGNSLVQHRPDCPGNTLEEDKQLEKHKPFANLKDLFKK